MINGVVFDDLPNGHEDERRRLFPIFNMDLPFQPAQQVKVSQIKTDSVLGRHYHRYAELFTVLAGQAEFTLGEAPSSETFLLVPGKRLLIPSFVFHEARVTTGTILIGLTEEPYVSPQHNDLQG